MAVRNSDLHHIYEIGMRHVTNAHSIGATKATPKSAKGSAKKRAATAKKEDGSGEDEVEASPTKKQRKSPAKKKVVAGRDEQEGPAKEEPADEE